MFWVLFVTLHHPLCSMCGHGEVCRTRAVNRVAACGQARYGSPVADSSAKVTVNPVAGRRNPISKRCNSPHTWLQVFSPAAQCYGGCVRAGFGLAGFLLPRYSYPVHSCHPIP